MENRELINLAKQAMENAYAPYSSFKVGAAVVGKKGTVYTGCNIENVSYGATNCAERTAMFKGVSEGEIEFKKIAIVSTAQDLTFPCGICRQVMAEFMRGGMVILEDKEGIIKEFSVEELLPKAFVR
ncbi:MAG TPA: cytidine deaminase [Lachnospiraceae bacterium]|nr:cytidine deaminase [Lachnospiraceae bacterium]